jgi:hypothetical protein
MKVALACVATAMMSTTAGADPGRNGAGACPTGAKMVELARRAFSDVKIEPNDLVCRVLRARVPTWLVTFAESGCGGAVAGAAAIVQNGVVKWSQPGFGGAGAPCRGGTWQLTGGSYQRVAVRTPTAVRLKRALTGAFSRLRSCSGVGRRPAKTTPHKCPRRPPVTRRGPAGIAEEGLIRVPSEPAGGGRVGRDVSLPPPTDPDMQNSRIVCWRQHTMR